MKEQFIGFYSPSDEDINEAWKSTQTLFVFDTNVFLNLYSYAETTRNDFFEVLDRIREKIWIPYHVGLEYQRNRLNTVKTEKAVFKQIEDSLNKIDKIFKNDIQSLKLKTRFPKLNESTEKLYKEISKSTSNYKRSLKYWDDLQPCVRSHDKIRAQLNDFFDKKIGDKPIDQAAIDQIQKEGEKRFSNKVPPGFEDASKEKDKNPSFVYDNIEYKRKFGDLIIWKEIINKAKDENIKNIVFITDDVKEDWWYILDSRGKKRIGPHANLQAEIYNESNIDSFHMYNTSDFLSEGKKILDIVIKDSSIDEIKNLFNIKINNQIIKKIDNLKFITDDHIIKNINLKDEDWSKLIEATKLQKKTILDYIDKNNNLKSPEVSTLFKTATEDDLFKSYWSKKLKEREDDNDEKED